MIDTTFVRNITPITADWLNGVNGRVVETVSARDFGALGNGSSGVLAIRAAVEYVYARGGGRVVLPDGIYGLDAATLISDPSPTTSLYRYWFQARPNVEIVGGPGAILKVDAGVVTGDSSKQYCKGYQIFWAWSIGTVNNFGVDGFTIDCNGVNNLAPAVNGYGSQIQTTPVVTNCGTNWRVKNLRVIGTSGRQCIAFYLGSSGIEITGNRFYDMAGSVTGNTQLGDHSTIYVEGSNALVSNNQFINTNYDKVSTAMEVHGVNNKVSGNIVHRYSLGMIRAAMTSDSYNVTNEGNVFTDVTIGVAFDASPGMRLEATIKNNQFRFRDYSQRGTRTMNAVNTAGSFSGRTGSNYAKIIVEGNTFTADATATAAGVNYIIGGNVDWLESRRNNVNGFTDYYTAGNFVDYSTVVFDEDVVSGAVNTLVTHKDFVGGQAAKHVDYKIANLDLSKSSATTFISCVYDNANIRYVTITGKYQIAITPFAGYYNVINTAWLCDYTTLSMSAKSVAPFITGTIYDVTNRATFFRDNVADPQRWRIKRQGTAVPTVVFAVESSDHQGDIMENRSPTAGGVSGWVCTTQSAAPGTVGTWKSYGAIAA